MLEIKLKVDFYADTFRSLELLVHKESEKLSDDNKREYVSKIISDYLHKNGIQWNERKNYSWIHSGGSCKDWYGIMIITCKVIHRSPLAILTA